MSLIKWYKIKHALIESFSYLFCSYTDIRNSFDIHISGCTHLRTKAWTCSLSEFSQELCCSLLFENHILQVSQIFPVTSTHRPLSGSLWWPQWPRKWCELRPCPSVWYTKDAFRWSGSFPLGGLHCWALQKSFSASQLAGQMWAQAQVVCFSPSLPHHIEI